jgi:hypothetical protein
MNSGDINAPLETFEVDITPMTPLAPPPNPYSALRPVPEREVPRT